ncbi:hypothetical protein D3C85_1820450 [compost metagenome]
MSGRMPLFLSAKAWMLMVSAPPTRAPVVSKASLRKRGELMVCVPFVRAIAPRTVD